MCVYIGESWESSSATECTKTLTLSTSTSTLILSDPPYINIYIDPVQERSYSIEDFKMRLTWKGTYFFCYASTRYLQLDPFTHHHSSEPNIIHNIVVFICQLTLWLNQVLCWSKTYSEEKHYTTISDLHGKIRCIWI